MRDESLAQVSFSIHAHRSAFYPCYLPVSTAHSKLVNISIRSSSFGGMKLWKADWDRHKSGNNAPYIGRARSHPLGVNLAASCLWVPRNWESCVDAFGIEIQTSRRSGVGANYFWPISRQNLIWTLSHLVPLLLFVS